VFTTLKARIAPVMITTGVAAALLLGGGGSASASTGTSATDATQPVVSVVTGQTTSPVAASGGDVTPMASACRTHNPPGAGSARACRTWYSQGGGYYYGSWSWSGTSGVYVQGSFDGDVFNLASTGTYSGVKRFLTRGCKAGHCTAWS
jgi:hypothetical protein